MYYLVTIAIDGGLIITDRTAENPKREYSELYEEEHYKDAWAYLFVCADTLLKNWKAQRDNPAAKAGYIFFCTMENEEDEKPSEILLSVEIDKTGTILLGGREEKMEAFYRPFAELCYKYELAPVEEPQNERQKEAADRMQGKRSKRNNKA